MATQEELVKLIEQKRLKYIALVSSIVHSELDAEDIFQESCIKALCGLSKFQDRSMLNTWLTRIVVNDSLTYLRRRLKNKKYLVFELDSPSIDIEGEGQFYPLVTDPNQYHFVLTNEIFDFLGLCGPEVSGLFEMLSNGFKYREIEKLTGVPAKTLRVRCLRLRKQIRTFLQGQRIVKKFKPRVISNKAKVKGAGK